MISLLLGEGDRQFYFIYVLFSDQREDQITQFLVHRTEN